MSCPSVPAGGLNPSELGASWPTTPNSPAATNSGSTVEVSDENLKAFFSQTMPLLDERERRLMAAAVVQMCGRGGQALVAATDKREAHSFYSNFALRPDLVAVSAPGGSAVPLCGEDVVSTMPAGSTTNPCRYPVGYDQLAGTSMATPHASGVAALLMAQGRTRYSALKALTSTARHPGTGTRGVYDPVYGYGIVDAAAAVAAPR